MKTALITGVSGFAGSYLAEHLLDKYSYNIIGTYNSGKGLRNIEKIKDKVTSIQVDLTNHDAIERIIQEKKPDAIFHLAALASPSESFKNPAETFTTNIIGQINLLEAVKESHLPQTKILIVSSAEVYGLVKENDLPIDEETAFHPTSPYAVSKITQEYLGVQYHFSYGLQVVRVRSFNHIGPRQTPQYVVASFAKQIAEIEKGMQEPLLQVGNLSARRDFTDVRDIVQAYALVIEKGDIGEVYNVGSGVSHEMGTILKILLSLSSVKIRIEVDKSRLRPLDIPDNRCNPEKVIQKTGWKESVSLEKSLQDTLDYWRNIL